MESEKFKFCILNTQYFKQALSCLTEVFTLIEPMGKHLNLTTYEMEHFLNELLLHAINLNLTWIAIDKETNELAGVRVLTDAFNDYEANFVPGENLKIIFSILNSLYINHQHELNTSKNTLLHTWMTAVYPKYQKKGLLKNLYKKGSHLAKTKGFQYCIGEASNIYNLNFLKKEANISQLNSIEYKSFKYFDTYPFKTLEEHYEIVLYKYPLKYYPEVTL